MPPTALKLFVQPQSVYQLEYPALWDAVVEKDGESCGFGPKDRDDVGLWISIMPMSLDTSKLAEHLPKMFTEALVKSESANLRVDPTLRHYGLTADMTKEGEAGHYWIVAGGDVVLFASSQVPTAERDLWNPPFHHLMTTLQITREDELLMRQVANDVLARLQEKHPDQEFTFEGNTIRGKGQAVYLSNVYREVKASPKRREKIIKHFVDTMSQPATADFGYEVWDEVQGCILPILKPRDYIHDEGPTQHLHATEWLDDVLICYAIRRKNMFRFVTGWDLNRWGLQAEAFHERTLVNLAKLSWPREMSGSRDKNGGRVIVVTTDDGLASSRLLHPELHHLFSGPLGKTFWAGIPCRDTLVLFSDRRDLKQRIGRRLKQDHHASAYAITPRPFLVTRDGIAPMVEK